MTTPQERAWLMVAIELARMQQTIKAQGLHHVSIGHSLHALKPRSTLNHK